MRRLLLILALGLSLAATGSACTPNDTDAGGAPAATDAPAASGGRPGY